MREGVFQRFYLHQLVGDGRYQRAYLSILSTSELTSAIYWGSVSKSFNAIEVGHES